MRIQMAGELRDLEERDIDPIISRSTNRPLRKVALEFVVGENLVDDLNDELGAAQSRRRKATFVDEDGTSWSVGNWSYSQRDNHPSYTYNVELKEIEGLNATRVRFAGLDLEVEYYSEEDYGESKPIIILVEFLPTPEQTDRIRQLQIDGDYFDLVRVGLTDEPIRVRLGRTIWQAIDSADGGNRQRRFQQAFVTERGDRPHPSNPQPGRVEEIALDERARLRALIDELVSLNVLSKDARSRVDAAGATGWEDDLLDVREVSDVTLYRH